MFPTICVYIYIHMCIYIYVYGRVGNVYMFHKVSTCNSNILIFYVVNLLALSLGISPFGLV